MNDCKYKINELGKCKKEVICPNCPDCTDEMELEVKTFLCKCCGEIFHKYKQKKNRGMIA